MERLPGSFEIEGRLAGDDAAGLPPEFDDPQPPSSTAPPSPAAPMRNDLRSIEDTISPHLSPAGWTTLPVIWTRVQSRFACTSHCPDASARGVSCSPQSPCAA